MACLVFGAEGEGAGLSRACRQRRLHWTQLERLDKVSRGANDYFKKKKRRMHARAFLSEPGAPKSMFFFTPLAEKRKKRA
jgi:hypothetical protein